MYVTNKIGFGLICFVLVKGSQIWGEPRAISVLSSTFFEWGMRISDGEESTFKEQPGILY